MRKQEVRYALNKLKLFVSIFVTCLSFIYDYKFLVLVGIVITGFILKQGVKLGEQRNG